MHSELTVSLINTPTQRYDEQSVGELHDYSTIPPLGLGYVATAASQIIGSRSVNFLDAEHLRLSPEEAAQRILEQRADFIGINVSSPNYAIAREIIYRVGSKLGRRLVAGGAHAILRADAILKDPEISPFLYGVCTGDGEPAIQSLLNGVERDEIPNFKYLNETGDVVSSAHTKRLSAVDISQLHLDRRFFLNDPFVHGNTIESYLLSSRGCPFRCAFCAAPKLCGQMTKRSDESLRTELETLILSGVNYIRFVDDLLITSEKRVLALKKIFDSLGLSKRNFGFEATARANITARFKRSTWRILEGMGLKELEVGIESGSPRVLLAMDKGTTREQVSQTVVQAVAHGVQLKGFLMVGYPTETGSDLDLTVEFARDLKAAGGEYIRFSPVIAKAYPGTALYENYQHLVAQFDDDVLLDLTEMTNYPYSSRELGLLKARTRYNAAHTHQGRPVVLSALTGGASLEEVLDALVKLILVSSENIDGVTL